MVLLKRTLDSRLNGYDSAAIPRAPRSIRRSGSRQKLLEGGQICAFDLLATVAGKLLEQSECSSASSSAALGFEQHGISEGAIKKEPQDVDKELGGEHDEQGSSEAGSVFFAGVQKDLCKGKLETVSETIGEHAPPISSSAYSDKVDSNSKLEIQESDGVFVNPANKIGGSPKCGDSEEIDLENAIKGQQDINKGTSGDFTTTECPAMANSEAKVKFPLCGDSHPNASFLKRVDDVKMACKDDDEIISRCSQPNNLMKTYRSSTKRLLTSKCWKTAPKLKDCEFSNMGGSVKHVYHKKRSIYDHDRSQRNTPFKKRKLFDRSSVVTYDGGISCESVSNSPEKSVDDEKNASAGKHHEENGISSSEFGRQKSCNNRNSHVRLSIKSFKVPELFIEVPESTTVGSLKRNVLEAVTTILGGGLRVGVLVHGKKIQDDNKTLLQSGISQSDDMDTIGFMLEPNSPTQPANPLYCEDYSIPLSCDSPKFVNRSQVNVNEDMYLPDTQDKPCMTDSNSPTESSRDLVPSYKTELEDKNISDSKAIIPVPEASVEALAIVPVIQRPNKHSEIGQRRTRRPFSVSEVEALVQAVEKLGTGRWRDVKLCAFENAKHRTYVDLKDKWKTLVHTARISPQQRRGEPVPQELLDRVLAAQAYWSDHQAKQHGKQQTIIPKLADLAAIKA